VQLDNLRQQVGLAIFGFLMVVVARQERSELPHHLTPLLELQDFMAALAALAGEQI
jgi:hypothetical protein